MNNLLKTAIGAALRAGGAILEVYTRDFEVELKEDQSPLTEADTVAHHIIIDALKDTGLPILSEESKAISYTERKAWTKYWLVDPLDGTKEFIKKNGEFTVNIALVEDGIPILGIVYVPVADTLYCGMSNTESEMPAWKTIGCIGKSFKEIREAAVGISTSGFSCSTKQRALRVVASKSHCNDKTRQFIAELEEQYGTAELVSRGSSLKLCMVAEGRADIYPRIAPTMEWDTVAAHAVVTAAGGRVFSFDASEGASRYTTGNIDLKDLLYNKENLLNTCFVVSGLHE